MSIDQAEISKKISKLLLILLFAFLLILVRVAFLAFSDRDTALERAQKPQRRLVIDAAARGEISDRYGIPLALNSPEYSLQFSYRPLLEIPRRQRRSLEDKTTVTTYPRREYIDLLCTFLEKEIGIEKKDLEDTILAEATLVPDLPIPLIQKITEEQYFRWKHLERKWPGLHASYKLTRTYPQGGSAGDLLGYVGPIHSEQFEQISSELKSLEDYLRQREEGFNPFLPEGFEHPKEVEKRAEILYEEAISLIDEVGISGLEKHFEHALRGLRGKHFFEKSRKSNVLAVLPGGEPKISGQHLKLALSSDLQKRAEELLRISEQEYFGLDRLWLHGGAIIAMDPHTGEILAMASEPHIEPQRILEKKKSDPNGAAQLLCSDDYLRGVWDGRFTPRKEMGPLVDPLSFQSFIDLTFHAESKARRALLQVRSLYEAKELIDLISYISAIYQKPERDILETIEIVSLEDISLSGEIDLVEKFLAAKEFLSHIPLDDRVLVFDVMRLFTPVLDPQFLKSHPSLTFSSFMEFRKRYISFLSKCKEECEAAYKSTLFADWRKTHFEGFLKEKRKEEKENRRYTKPYTEYLNQEFKKQFALFWEAKKEKIVLSALFGTSMEEAAFWQLCISNLKKNISDLPIESLRNTLSELDEKEKQDLLASAQPCKKLQTTLWGKYPRLRNYSFSHPQTLEDLALSFFRPMTSLHQSMSYREYIPQGSLFKLLIAYQALEDRIKNLSYGNYSSLNLNPLTLIDDNHPKTRKVGDQLLGYFEDHTPIKRIYKGHLLPRSSHPGIGKVDLLGALEQSSNLYFSILGAEHISSVDALLETTRAFGFGEKTGIELPGEVRGNIPTDLKNNLTNLYAFSIGQHSLTVTPLQTAKMMGALATHGTLVTPKLCLDLGKRQMDTTYQDETIEITEELKALGLPLNFLSVKDKKLRFHYNLKLKERPSSFIKIPDPIERELLEGMKRVVHGPRGTARLAAVRTAKLPPSVTELYKIERDYIIGKTSTAEIMLKTTLDRESVAKLKNHVWFGAIGYDRPIHEEGATPDLIIVVALKYRDAGKDAAGLAGALHHEWRKIQERLKEKKS